MMKKLVSILILFVLMMPAVFAHDWRKVVIEHIQTDYSDNQALVTVKLDNELRDIKNLKVTVIMPDLDVRKRIGPFELEQSGEEIKHIVLDLENIEPDDYIVRITVNDGNVRRVKHRFITII